MPASLYFAELVFTDYFTDDTYYVGLHDEDPTPLAVSTSEVSGGDYLRAATTFSEYDTGVYINDDDLVFSSLPALSLGVNYISVWTAQTDGTMRCYDDITNIDFSTAGGNLTIPAGILKIRIKVNDS